MTPEEAFKAGAGSETAMTDISNLITIVGAGAVFLIAGWMIYSGYKGWTKGVLSSGDYGSLAVKSIILVLITIWLVS